MNFALEALLMHSWMRHFFMLPSSVDVCMWKYFANRKLFYFHHPSNPRHEFSFSARWKTRSIQKSFWEHSAKNFVIINMHFICTYIALTRFKHCGKLTQLKEEERNFSTSKSILKIPSALHEKQEIRRFFSSPSLES